METAITKKKTTLNIDNMRKTCRTAPLSLMVWLYGDGEWKVCKVYKTQGCGQEVSPFIPLGWGQTGWMSLRRRPIPPSHSGLVGLQNYTALPRKHGATQASESWKRTEGTKSVNPSQLSLLAATTWHLMRSQLRVISLFLSFFHHSLFVHISSCIFT